MTLPLQCLRRLHFKAGTHCERHWPTINLGLGRCEAANLLPRKTANHLGEQPGLLQVTHHERDGIL